jgi:hypothetical protein
MLLLPVGHDLLQRIDIGQLVDHDEKYIVRSDALLMQLENDCKQWIDFTHAGSTIGMCLTIGCIAALSSSKEAPMPKLNSGASRTGLIEADRRSPTLCKAA